MHSDNVLPLYIHLNADTCADRVACYSMILKGIAVDMFMSRRNLRYLCCNLLKWPIIGLYVVSVRVMALVCLVN